MCERLAPKHRKLMLEDPVWPSSTWSVCRSPRPSNRGNLVAITAMILMRPGEGHLEACLMLALNRRFMTYTLSPDRTAQKQAEE